MPEPARMARAVLLAVALLALASAPLRAGDGGPEGAAAGAPRPQTGAAEAEPAAEPGGAAAGEEVVIFDRLMVVGGPGEAFEIPGSAHYLGAEELAAQAYGDIHRLLRQVPGVNLQEEEGYGLRPNIGMRGTGVERSQKVTLLEDGVLIAPAPYAAPAAYYFPTTGRMEAVEVRKGSSSVRQGPYTNGGVLNLVSTPIPAPLAARVEAAAGEDDTRRLRAFAGGSGARWGWLLETYQLTTDGFKRLDGGGPAGVELEDYLAKLRFSGERDRTLELKLGKTEQLGHETYLGLTEADFRRRPYRRYAASARDLLTTDHEQIQVRYFARPGRGIDLTATAYRNDFFRNWYKLQSVAGVDIGEVLASPAAFPGELALVRGEVESAGGPLALRANRRDYYARGVETVLAFSPAGGRHELEVGVRWHQDQEDRFQEEDAFDSTAGGLELARRGAPGSQSNRLSDAEALAVFVQERIALGRWTLTPGVRFESIDFRHRDFGRADPERSGGELEERRNGVDVVIPGFGASYAAGRRLSLFAGVHKGFSPPAPGQDRRADPEESVNLELGVRYAGDRTRLAVVGFFSDYDNLLGTDTLSSGGTGSGDQFNGGAVEVAGLEVALDADLGHCFGGAVRVPVRLAYTYTEAEFRSSFATSFADWAPRVEAGDALPYLPAHQGSLALGFEGQRWDAHFNLAYTDAMRTQAGRGPNPAGQGTDEHWVVDLAAGLALPHRLRLTAQLRNLTDDAYVVARRPAGLRPGLPRTALLGLSWER